jgi:ZIP family zinc transporter
MRAALLASLLAGLATGVGGLFVAVIPRWTRGMYDTLLGFSAGVMLAAGSITLLGPTIWGNHLYWVAGGLLCGSALILALERVVPHLEPHFAPELNGPSKRLGLLMAAALSLHHIPEGLAIGVAFGGQSPEYKSLGMIVALAIGLQNIPEGLAVAMPLRHAGMSRLRAVFWSSASGLVEPVAAGIGYLFARHVAPAVPFSLALAAGAMIFVASDQLIPESHQRVGAKAPSVGLVLGFVLVATLTKAL